MGAAAWKPWTVAVAFVGAVGLGLVGRAIVSVVEGRSAGAVLGGGIALCSVSVAPVALALHFARRQGRSTASDFGLRRPSLRRAAALVFAFLVGLTALVVVWGEVFGLEGEEGQPLSERLGTDGAINVLILIVVLTVLGPLGEEFLFRGYIFRALRNWRGVWSAAIVSGGLFAAIHVGWLPISLLVPIAIFGIGMCLLYHWTGSLYPCIAAHAINNSIPLGSALDWTWQTPALIAGSALAALTVARLIALQLEDVGDADTALAS